MLGTSSYNEGRWPVPEVDCWRSQQAQCGQLALSLEGLPRATHQLMALSLLLPSPLFRQSNKVEIWYLARFVAGDCGPVCQLTAWDGRVRAGRELHWGWDSAAWLWHTGGRHWVYVAKCTVRTARWKMSHCQIKWMTQLKFSKVRWSRYALYT